MSRSSVAICNSSVAIRKAILSLTLLLLAACGGSGSGGNNVALQTIAITPANPSQRLGMTLQLVATGTYSDGTTRDVSSTATWSSSKTSVAAVSAAGLVSTVEIGTSIITATLGAVEGSAAMLVTPGTAVESILYNFGTAASDGLHPASAPIQASDGNFYGTTPDGGTHNCIFTGCGTVYKITPAGAETVLYSFGTSPSDGANPLGSLIQASDGNFYGTTATGGANTCPLNQPHSCGTVFKVTPAGVETVLYSFGASPSDGANPWGPLIQASDGNFYGTTANGGANGAGTVFKITPAGIETVLYSFGASPSDGADPVVNSGTTPSGSLIQGSDGNFYGTTINGGPNSCYFGHPNTCGTVFKITPAGVETVLHSFGASASDGYDPQGLIQAGDGNLYGTTVAGGANGVGSVFEITPAGVETILYSFSASPSNGANPMAPLLQASDGNFYGVTSGATGLDSGAVFKLTP